MTKLTTVPFKLDEAFLELVDRSRGLHSRSHFIREALARHLAALGITVPDAMVYPPDRTGKAASPVCGPALQDASQPRQ